MSDEREGMIEGKSAAKTVRTLQNQITALTARLAEDESALERAKDDAEGYRLDAEFFKGKYEEINTHIGGQLAAARAEAVREFADFAKDAWPWATPVLSDLLARFLAQAGKEPSHD